MKYLVLGGGGFLGRSLVSHLSRKGDEIISYDIFHSHFFLGVNHIEGDFSKEDRWTEILKGVDVCFHLVSATLPKTSNENPCLDVEKNLLGTLNLLAAAKLAKMPKIIFSSSGGTVYGNVGFNRISENSPLNPICSYGIVKLAIENYLYMFQELYGLEYVVLRLANLYGPGQNFSGIQGAPAVFLGKALAGDAIDVWGAGDQVRDYVYVDDAVEAFVKASSYSGSERIFNIGSGVGVSINELIDIIKLLTFEHVVVNYSPHRGLDVLHNVLCPNKAAELLGWRANTNISQGMREMRDWAISTYNFYKGAPPQLK